jgi:GT2 family glycosyltransferase
VLNCLQSLGSDLGTEIFVVDNASGDNVISEIQNQYPEVKTMALERNIGFSAANNLALSQVNGEFVLFLNPDTLVTSEVLSRCVEFLQNQPESVGAMGCRVQTTEGVTQWECNRKLTTPKTECLRAIWPFSPPEALPPSALEKTGPTSCLLGAFMLFRKSVLDKIGGFDEQFFLMYEDIDLCKRTLDAGFSIVYWPEVSIKHLGGSSWKQEKVETYANSHASALKYIKKHYPGSLWYVKFIVQLGMELRILALRLRKTNSWTQEHLLMARAAREALKNA